MVAAIRAAKDALDVPVFVKLSPLGREMGRAATLAQAAGADAIVAINSFGPCLSIDIETGLPRMGGADGYGWLSGPALKPLALRCVHDVARAVDIPVIGCGGVSRGTDAIEMIMAGASAVQVCTAAILRGPARIREDRRRDDDVAGGPRVRRPGRDPRPVPAAQRPGTWAQRAPPRPGPVQRLRPVRAVLHRGRHPRRRQEGHPRRGAAAPTAGCASAAVARARSCGRPPST